MTDDHNMAAAPSSTGMRTPLPAPEPPVGSKCEPKRRWRFKAWAGANWKAISAAGAIAAFLVSTYLTWRSLSDTLNITRQVAAVNLARDLSSEFDGTAVFEEIRRRMVDCTLGEGEAPGLVATGGLNRFLNFLDDVGLYYRLGAIDFEVVDHLFGSLIIETYQYPGMQQRIAGVESKGREVGANREFLALGKALSSQYPAQAEYWKKHCDRKNANSTGGPKP